MIEEQLTTSTATFEELLEFIYNHGYIIKFGKTDLSNDFKDVPYIELQRDDKCYRTMCGDNFRKPLECAVVDIIENKYDNTKKTI